MKFPIYTSAYGLGLLFAWPYFQLRGAGREKYRWHLTSRMARGNLDFPPKGTAPRLWVHALSLGEVIAAEPLVQALNSAGYEVLFSTTTMSGAERARNNLERLHRFVLPLDWPPLVEKVIDRAIPDAFVLVETDIWPNILAGLEKKSIPAVLVGARVSPRSFRGYQLLGSFWSRVLHLFREIGCQTGLDRDRMIALGAPADRTVVTGNLKFDRPAPVTGEAVRQALLQRVGLPDGIWFVAGSTHAGEEKIILSAYGRLKPEFPDLRLLIAPRDADRFETVWSLVQSSGFPAARRSVPGQEAAPSIYVLDTLGELDEFYEIADMAFVGKSLPVPGEGGGHNLIEPAIRSKPVLFGPRVHDFLEIARMLTESGGGRQVENEDQMAAEMRRLAEDVDLRLRMGRAARAAMEPHRGAIKRNMDLIETALRGSGPGMGRFAGIF